jgi:hypothetical protein
MVDSMAVGTKHNTFLFDFFVGGSVSTVLYKVAYVLLVWVIRGYVMEVEDGWV